MTLKSFATLPTMLLLLYLIYVILPII